MANLKLTFDDFESNDFELLAIHSNLKDFKLTFLNSLNILHYIEKNEKYKELSGIFYSITVNALFCYVLSHFNSDDDTFRDLLNEDLKNLKWRLVSGSVL